jgi:hypothetical protein
LSTILKALRRLEEERAARADRALREEVVAASPPPAPRGTRALPIGAAALALAAAVLGIGLAVRPWLAGRTTPPSVSSPPPSPVLASPPRTAPVAAPEPAPVIIAIAPDPAPVAALAPTPQAEPPIFAAASEPQAALPVVAAASEPEGVPLSALPDAVSPPHGEARGEDAAPLPAVEPLPAAEPLPIAAPIAPAPAAARPRPEPAARPAPKPAAVAHPARGSGVVVASTVWHPTAERRVAVVRRSGSSGEQEVHEGEVVAGLEVLRIEPSGVVFLRDGHEFRQPVGDGR